ncbi:ABC transporter ATP-binding protein [Humitalea sp. 24SJ18S-53]|uniref:ABC transporter ATP-binding protein n=1 Tax=Humitalea sp. 24SJ18S-53 TaxID=3422307 RepID=UPI003D66A2AB
MADPLLRLSNLRKIYDAAAGPVEALQHVSLDIAQGEFVSVLGPSGCGKSTLLMLIAGLETPSAGEVVLNGTRVVAPRRESAVVFQDATLLPWKSAMANVLYPAEILGLPIPAYRARASVLLDQVGLQGFHDRRPAQLSGGMRQRVALCRALAQDPALLLMDEPFSALDAITRDEMNMLMLRLWDSEPHRTAVFVTHSIREAALLSDRVIVMRRRPCTVIADLRMPFARPRRAELVDTPEFTAICADLRRLIEASMQPLVTA